MIALLASACVPVTPSAPTAGPSGPVEQAPDGAQAPSGYDGRAWADFLAEARGQTVNFYMWGGSDVINAFVSEYAATQVRERYAVTLNLVPVADAPEYINRVLGEQQASQDTAGSVDLVWINGENFRTMRQGGLLYGPWSQFLPNSRFVNWQAPSIANDFGYPVEGFESPYGQAQFVMIYDSARVPEPPTSVPALLDWIRANPGRFTYPAPPDFTGSAFVRQVCYSTADGFETLLGDFDQGVFDATLPACWETLEALEPALWRSGQTYPESRARMIDLFANGEVDFDMAYNPAEASSLIAQGRYPETVRTFVFDEGTIANTHYLAIPYNSPHKAAAMVVANFMLSPEAQLAKADPAGWGDLPALDPALLPAELRTQFEALPRGPATLPADVLAAGQLPELQAPWLSAIEEAWLVNVLEQ
jgi:putative spermidine/putrescine transport system substrate-binding protein